MLKEFKPGNPLVRVDNPDDAEFFVEFTSINRGVSGTLAFEEGVLESYWS